MKSNRHAWVMLAAMTLGAMAGARSNESMEQLKARAHGANLEQRIGPSIEIARRQVTQANALYSAGRPEEADAAVQDVVTYTEVARDAATRTGKKMKNVEIAAREMAHKMRDIKHSLAFEYQSPAQHAIDRLEKVRTDLLAKMFGKGAK